MEDEEKEQREQEEHDASKKAVRTGAKAVATAYGGKVGAKAVDLASKSKAGDKALDKAADEANKNRHFRNAAKKANENGTLDAAEKTVDSASGSKTNATGKTTSKGAESKTPNNNNQANSSTATTNDNKSGTVKGIISLNNPVIRKIMIACIPGVLFISLIVYIIAVLTGAGDSNGGSGLATSGYYASQCDEVTVIFTDKKNGYSVTGTGTYPLEEYVAGVIAGEVGFFGSLEVDKAFAIAARSYLLTHESNCTIESSDRKQVFRKLTDSPNDKLALEAAEATKGQVLLQNNQLVSSQYDAFACIAKDNNYYTISQGNQKVPKTWIESKINPANKPEWFICNGKENLVNHHGNGMSQYGSLYLANEQNYTYNQILGFYLGENMTISSESYTITDIDLDIKVTDNAQTLNVRLDQFLGERGSNVDKMNAFIHDNVVKNGAGTRAGVVTAAVSLVNYLYDGYHIKLPYYWGGSYQHNGVNPAFGGITTPSASSTTVYNYSGMDCSGFVSWAIKNGGYNMGRKTTTAFHQSFGTNSCNIRDANCKGRPGDLINSASCHVQLIIDVDEKAGIYYIAESLGGNNGLAIRKWNMHSGNCGAAETRIINMDSFYNNSANIDTSY